MTITYKGKVYEEVTDVSAEIGDLLHVTVLDGNASDVWCFSTDSYYFVPDVDIKIPRHNNSLDDDYDVWTRYREVITHKKNKQDVPPITFDTERYRVVNTAVTPPAGVVTSADEFITLTKNMKLTTTFSDIKDASEAAKVANSYGLGDFRVYTESTVLTYAEAVDID